jgi:hypothetical protein
LKSLSLLRSLPGIKLRGSVVCPNCWHEFAPEDVLWIAVSPKLADEPVLPALATGKEQRRFVPERFDVLGHALDAEGTPCAQFACPRCRLDIPRPALELPSFVLSVLGTPGSGKSVFLASMIFETRQQAASLGLRFQDADLVLNKELLDAEQKLFLDPEAEDYRQIDAAVEKTKIELGEKRYRKTKIDGHDVAFVTPFTFIVAPTSSHPRAEAASSLSRLLCLYDNAGEHFRPGADRADQPLTRHLAASKGLIFTFDPTKYRRLQKAIGAQWKADRSEDRQDAVLLEAGRIIRDHAGIGSSAQLPQPLVVAVTKFDVWRPLFTGSIEDLKILRTYPGSDSAKALYLDTVETISRLCRAILWEYAREIVSAAESLSGDVIYVPVAALGWDVQIDPRTGAMRSRTANAEPFGVLVPMLYLLLKGGSRLVLTVRRKD